MSTSNEAFFDALTRHQIGLARLSSTLTNQVVAILDSTESAIKRVIKQFTRRRDLTRPLSAGKLEALASKIANIRGDAWAKIATIWNESMTGLVLSEPEFMSMATKTVLPVRIEPGIPEKAALLALLISTTFEGRTLERWIEDSTQADTRRIIDEVNIGITQQETANTISSRVVGTTAFDGTDGATQTTRNGLAALTVTMITHYSNQAKKLYYIENFKIITKERYTAILDAGTTAICRSLNGLLFNVGEGRFPPIHFNALVEGSLIHTEHGQKPIEHVRVGERVLTHKGQLKPVTAVMSKLDHTIDVIEMKFDSGRVARMSDDHPVLSVLRGWITAGEFNCGDEAFQYTEQPVRLNLIPHIDMIANNHPAPIGESFIPGQVRTNAGAMASSINLKGDFSSRPSKVKYECADNILVNKFNFPFIKNINNALLRPYRGFSPFISKSIAHLDACLKICGRVVLRHPNATFLRRRLRSFWLFFTPVFISRRHDDMLSVGYNAVDPTSNWNLVFSTKIRDFPRLDTQIPADGPDGIPILPMLCLDNGSEFVAANHFIYSRVVSKRNIAYKMPLYNIAVKDDESYIAEGVIVHNCRSMRIAVYDNKILATKQTKLAVDRRLLDEYTRKNDLTSVSSRGALPIGHRARFDQFSVKRVEQLIGGVPDEITTNQFFLRQSKAFQDEALGVTKAKLWRDGGLPLTKFVNRVGDELTLSELAVSDKSAFIKAGLDPDNFI